MIRLQPQLATPALEAPEGDRWLHEVKHDGYRMIAAVEGGRVRLLSRGGADYADRAPAVAAELSLLADDVVLDGELVILRRNGTSDFQALQGALRRSRPRADLTYFCWDALRLRGESLLGLPLLERKRRLARLLEGHLVHLRYVDHIVGNGPEVYRLACVLGAEGIVSKRIDSVYRPGRRAQSWVKVKAWTTAEFVVGGFTEVATREYPYGALLLGLEDDTGQLHYAGRVSLGWSARQARALTDRLTAALCEGSPFTTTPSRTARWTRPQFVANVKFLEITRDGQFRHATVKKIVPRATR